MIKLLSSLEFRLVFNIIDVEEVSEFLDFNGPVDHPDRFEEDRQGEVDIKLFFVSH